MEDKEAARFLGGHPFGLSRTKPTQNQTHSQPSARSNEPGPAFTKANRTSASISKLIPI
jgi:hypothetical protein